MVRGGFNLYIIISQEKVLHKSLHGAVEVYEWRPVGW